MAAMDVTGSLDGGDDATPVDLDPTTAAERKRFHETAADTLARAVGVNVKRANKPAEKFAYYDDANRFVVVAGVQEKHEVALALARGLGLRGNRRLVLVMPEAHCFATMQRAPWLRAEAQPEVWTYGEGAPVRQKLRTCTQSEEMLRARLKPGQSLEDELVASSTAKHLGTHSAAVWELVEWATSHPRLDPSHLRGERAWHCLGQKVLSIKVSRGELAVRVGIHYSGANASKPLTAKIADPMSGGKLEEVKSAVEAGIACRVDSTDPQIHRADEHWLQAVIRRDPSLVGVEQPALREFPAWRPRDDAKRWGRGYIDLMGVDGHGNIRIVETKVARNDDEMLILQGLDYYIWAQVYAKDVRRRLSVTPRSTFEIHYVIGDTSGALYVAAQALAQVRALGEKIPWRFHTIKGWYGHPDTTPRPTPRLLPLDQVPPAKGAKP